MPNRRDINEIAKLATELTGHELTDSSNPKSPEMLEALTQVTAELKRQAGDDQRIAALVAQVERLIAAKS